MQFDENYIYHIYNQGNNRRKIFFCKDNYLFFLKKIETHICPYADILVWCLMPKDPKSGRDLGKPIFIPKNLNKDIGIMLALYTRAINIQENFTGSLFRKRTKTICINCPEGLSPSFYDTEFGTMFYDCQPFEQYPQVCFNYIHQNSVKARLVQKAIDWEFSSAQDYVELRKDALNKSIACEYLDTRI